MARDTTRRPALPEPTWGVGVALPLASLLVMALAQAGGSQWLSTLEPGPAMRYAIIYRQDLASFFGYGSTLILVGVTIFAMGAMPRVRELIAPKASLRGLLEASIAGVVLGCAAMLAQHMLSPAGLAPVTAEGGMVEVMWLLLAAVPGLTLAPICEELLFRRFFYLWLRRKLPLLAAIGVSSAAFGLVHGTDYVAVLAGLLGIISCVLYERTRSLHTCIVVHAADTLTIHLLQIAIFL